MDVAALLAESLVAHNQARTARTRGQATEAARLLGVALARRIEAHTADPEHTQDAWNTPVMGKQWKDRYGAVTGTMRSHGEMHEELLAFYRQQGAE